MLGLNCVLHKLDENMKKYVVIVLLIVILSFMLRMEETKIEERGNTEITQINYKPIFCQLRMHFKGKGVVSVNNVNYTEDTTLNFTINSHVNLLAHNIGNSSHTVIFEKWIINGREINKNPLILRCNSTFEIIPIFEIITRKKACSKPLLEFLDLKNMVSVVELEGDYVELRNGYIEFKRGYIFIPLEKPLPLFDKECNGWIKISHIKASVSSTARGEEGIMEDFMLFLVLDKGVVIRDILESPIVAIGYWYSGIGGSGYIVKKFLFYDGRENPRLEYLAILRKNRLDSNIIVDVREVLSQNFLPLKLFRDRRIVGIYVFGYDEGFVDFKKAIVEYGGG